MIFWFFVANFVLIAVFFQKEAVSALFALVFPDLVRKAIRRLIDSSYTKPVSYKEFKKAFSASVISALTILEEINAVIYFSFSVCFQVDADILLELVPDRAFPASELASSMDAVLD